MLFLGATPPTADQREAPSNHSPLVTFDDAVLPDGAALYAALAARRLTARQPGPTVIPNPTGRHLGAGAASDRTGRQVG
jgi:hypothetical protein